MIDPNTESNKKHIIYLKMCQEMAALSKCRKVSVASMIVYNGRIIATGVNGTPSGHSCNCKDKFKDHNDEKFLAEHSQWSLVHEIHSEMNAIIFAAKNGIEINPESVMYCTHEPCDNCLKHIAGVGIKTVLYINKYYHNIKENIFNLNILQVDINNL